MLSNRENAVKTLIKGMSRLHKKDEFSKVIFNAFGYIYMLSVKLKKCNVLQEIKYFVVEEERSSPCQSKLYLRVP